MKPGKKLEKTLLEQMHLSLLTLEEVNQLLNQIARNKALHSAEVMAELFDEHMCELGRQYYEDNVLGVTEL